MDDRQSVLGFTEAELGFFLAALCLVLWLVSTAAAPGPQLPEDEMIPADSAQVLEVELAAAQAARDSLDDAYQRLRDSVSGILPSCARIGKADGALWTITVVARDRVRLSGETMSFDQLGARTWRERERVLGTCLHQVVVRFPRTASGSVTEHTRGQLARLRMRISKVEWVARARGGE